MLQSVIVILFFALVVGLMVTRKLPALVALPLMAIGVCLIAGVPAFATGSEGTEIGFVKTVIEDGSVRLGATFMAVIFGSWLGQMLNRTGVTESIIKKAGELGGDRPLVTVLILSLVISGLFTVLYGLGGIVMVGQIVLPILLTIGVPALSAASIFLLSYSTGIALNVIQWKLFSSIFGVDTSVIRGWALVMAGVNLVATLVLILVEFKRSGMRYGMSAREDASTKSEEPGRQNLIGGWRGVLAMITPVIPILLVGVFNVPAITSFIIALVWIAIFITSGFGDTIKLLTKTCYEGITDAAPAIILFVGIGMLLNATTNKQVASVLAPMINYITPKSAIAFALIFILLAPLSLYRGPLHINGLGSGVAGLMMASGAVPAAALFGAFFSLDRINVPADPTNSMNVWTGNYVGCDPVAILKRLLPYVWIVAAAGVGYTIAVSF
jgi:H+/gluconate symporter-like permease